MTATAARDNVEKISSTALESVATRSVFMVASRKRSLDSYTLRPCALLRPNNFSVSMPRRLSEKWFDRLWNSSWRAPATCWAVLPMSTIWRMIAGNTMSAIKPDTQSRGKTTTSSMSGTMTMDAIFGRIRRR